MEYKNIQHQKEWYGEVGNFLSIHPLYKDELAEKGLIFLDGLF